jgi:hypothetical protein
MEFVGGLAAVALVLGALYLLLARSARGAKWLTAMVLKLSYRLSGLILAAIAVEKVIAGIKSDDFGLWSKDSGAQVQVIQGAKAVGLETIG